MESQLGLLDVSAGYFSQIHLVKKVGRRDPTVRPRSLNATLRRTTRSPTTKQSAKLSTESTETPVHPPSRLTLLFIRFIIISPPQPNLDLNLHLLYKGFAEAAILATRDLRRSFRMWRRKRVICRGSPECAIPERDDGMQGPPFPQIFTVSRCHDFTSLVKQILKKIFRSTNYEEREACTVSQILHIASHDILPNPDTPSVICTPSNQTWSQTRLSAHCTQTATLRADHLDLHRGTDRHDWRDLLHDFLWKRQSLAGYWHKDDAGAGGTRALGDGTAQCTERDKMEYKQAGGGILSDRTQSFHTVSTLSNTASSSIHILSAILTTSIPIHT
ncbi:uncharacterized protein BDR25DRAFT_363494 [Lindgomyces ingoldianus]|uniref:Uncharacterized protein n=1 Tax=Lindgomyces ingoldianus TaxID=673940 RepID=A0ACB6Q7M4_9PLEO|nr:uncharacterized protein BDR25DRAFT_363494 [Lindgomyces ingoldianus]KAF2462836.1 hypothetical protein BDR25DRAFT_363494 [Lindgomyces ingoldianus]